MDFLWLKMPDEYSMRNQTPFQQVKAVVDAVKVYENLLHNELKKVANIKAEMAMIMVSDEYAEKVLKEMK